MTHSSLRIEVGFPDQWRVLIVVAVTQPFWSHDQVGGARQTHARDAVWPDFEIYSLQLAKLMEVHGVYKHLLMLMLKVIGAMILFLEFQLIQMEFGL